MKRVTDMRLPGIDKALRPDPHTCGAAAARYESGLDATECYCLSSSRKACRYPLHVVPRLGLPVPGGPDAGPEAGGVVVGIRRTYLCGAGMGGVR